MLRPFSLSQESVTLRANSDLNCTLTVRALSGAWMRAAKHLGTANLSEEKRRHEHV
jgi:hypothetical protein